MKISVIGCLVISHQLSRNVDPGANDVASGEQRTGQGGKRLAVHAGLGQSAGVTAKRSQRMTAILAAQGFVLVIWAYIAFRTLFRVMALLRYRSGEAIPGLATVFSAPAVFSTDHAFRRERRWLGLLTLLLLVLAALSATQR
jgi:hypothetical protein